MATGLLPLTFGEAKFSQTLLDADKGYVADVRLGLRTTTGDAEGEVLETLPVAVDAVGIERACASFVGEIDQVPPMYSALKRDGKPLYEYARAGIELERSARRVTIHDLKVVSTTSDGFVMEVRCSKAPTFELWPRISVVFWGAVRIFAACDAFRSVRTKRRAAITFEALEMADEGPDGTRCSPRSMPCWPTCRSNGWMISNQEYCSMAAS